MIFWDNPHTVHLWCEEYGITEDIQQGKTEHKSACVLQAETNSMYQICVSKIVYS